MIGVDPAYPHGLLFKQETKSLEWQYIQVYNLKLTNYYGPCIPLSIGHIIKNGIDLIDLQFGNASKSTTNLPFLKEFFEGMGK